MEPLFEDYPKNKAEVVSEGMWSLGHGACVNEKMKVVSEKMVFKEGRPLTMVVLSSGCQRYAFDFSVKVRPVLASRLSLIHI